MLHVLQEILYIYVFGNKDILVHILGYMNNIVDYEYLFWINKIVHRAITDAHQNHVLVTNVFKCYQLWHFNDQ